MYRRLTKKTIRTKLQYIHSYLTTSMVSQARRDLLEVITHLIEEEKKKKK